MEIETVDSFLEYYEKIRGRTLRIATHIPEERIEWSHHPGKFTFGDLLRHLAGIERYMFAEQVVGRSNRYPGHDRSLAEGYDAVFEYFNRLHGETVELIGSLTDDQLQEKCLTPAGHPITRWKWLRAMVEHEIHHRGQLYMMLGILDIETPPLFGMTSEEVKAQGEAK